MTELTDLSNEYREQVENLKTNLSKAVKEAFKGFWDQNPEVYALAWTQYTPYFNDGDECIFGVYDIYPLTKELTEDVQSGDRSIWDCDIESEYKYGDKKGQPIPGWITQANNFIRILSGIDKDIMKAAFGDHCRVIATRDGFDVEEYEHD